MLTNENLVKEIKQGINEKENLESLYLNNKRFIYKIANKYKGYEDLDDLMQIGFIGMYEAIEPYDETKGFKFLTYARWRIEQAITRYLEENDMIRIPSHLTQRIHQYKRLRNQYKSILHREPTDREYCMALRIDLEQLKDTRKALHRYKCIRSLNEPIRGSDDEDMTLGDSITSNIDLENSVIDNVMREKAKSELWEIVSRECTPEQNKVINCRYRGEYTLKQTGKIVGITPERVRVVQSDALRKLRVPRVSRELRAKFEVNEARAYRSSLSNFKRTGTSSTEMVALKNLEIMGIN
jgi:RNA polymerase primary sigma factor